MIHMHNSSMQHIYLMLLMLLTLMLHEKPVCNIQEQQIREENIHYIAVNDL